MEKSKTRPLPVCRKCGEIHLKADSLISLAVIINNYILPIISREMLNFQRLTTILPVKPQYLVFE
jgi:hypothetical protein